MENRPGLTLMPSTPALADADLALARATGAHTILRTLLARGSSSYDYVVIDTPPAVGMYVISAVVAADGIVAPFLAAYHSLAGLRRIEETVERARESLGSRAKVLGYVLFGADGREGITEQAREIVKREAPGKLFKAEIRVSTAAKASPARRATAWDEGEDARGLEDYGELLREIVARLGR